MINQLVINRLWSIFFILGLNGLQLKVWFNLKKFLEIFQTWRCFVFYS